MIGKKKSDIPPVGDRLQQNEEWIGLVLADELIART